MILRPLLLALTLTAPATAPAQSFEEAVRSNVSLAVQLCAGSHQSADLWLGAFRAAGFAERVERLNPGDTNHHFDAPAGTATATVYIGQMAPDCTVTSNHLGVTAASALMDDIVPRAWPGKYGRSAVAGAPDPATGQPALCVRYSETGAGLPEVITVLAGGTDACVENGTSRIIVATLV